MKQTERSDRLRQRGLTPTIQRLAVLDCLERTKKHPTADQVLFSVRETFPSVSRATVYNTLQALTKAGIILQLTVDPAVSRYDADLAPHAHFRCRICNTVYDIGLDEESNLENHIEGHHIEAIRTYAYGVCKNCLAKEKPSSDKSTRSQKGELSEITSLKNSPAQPTQRETASFSDEPTKNIRGKSSKMASQTDSPMNVAQRNPKDFSNEPTKEVRDARTS